MKVILAIGAVVALLVAQPCPTEGGSYQWKDEQGVRHFSDQPPPRETQVPVEPLVAFEKKPSSTPVPPPPSPETEVKGPAVANTPVTATHEMIFGRWKPYSPQLRKEISEQMKTDKKDKGGLAGAIGDAIGDAMATGFVTGMMESMRIEFTRDTVTTEVMGEKQTANYSVVRIENDTIVLKTEKKPKNAIIHVLDDSHITFQEDGKGHPMTMVRDDGKSK